MTQIVFFCPPVATINGGIKHIFRMAEYLRQTGHDAVVFEQQAQRPGWFASTVPVCDQSILRPFDADKDNQIYVLPEDQPHILADFAKFPQRKVIYSQNHFYGALGIGEAQSYADYGVTHMLCSSRTIYDHCCDRHPSLIAAIIPCSIEPAIFKPAAEKRNIIAYMPRKRAIEATYIRDMFCFTYPHYRDWLWQELSGLNESDVAVAMGKAKVFLSLSRLEGFGLTPLEAMASGCVVAGFTGIGGRDYATNENGFWAAEDDFPACVSQLGHAVQLSRQPQSLAFKALQTACQSTLTAYTPHSFQQAVTAAWSAILASA